MGKAASPFTDEQILVLLNNPYVANVTPHTLTMTYEFKELFMQETVKPGMTARKIFASCGLDADIIGEARIKNIGKMIRKEAASPEGLRPVKVTTLEERMETFAKRDLSRVRPSDLKALQDEILLLRQEVEFLKKISDICYRNSRHGEPKNTPAGPDTS